MVASVYPQNLKKYVFFMIFMFFFEILSHQTCFFKFCFQAKGTPFLKIPALPGNREKSSYRVSVSLPGVGKIPVLKLKSTKKLKIQNSEPQIPRGVTELGLDRALLRIPKRRHGSQDPNFHELGQIRSKSIEIDANRFLSVSGPRICQ